MRKLTLVLGFFSLSSSLLIITLILFSYFSYLDLTHTHVLSRSHDKNVAYAALPSADASIEVEATQDDGRVENLQNFFARYHSPLESYAEDIVIAADMYHLDYRLLPSIAMQESGGCQKIIKDSYNCYGFGIYSKKVTRFSDYKEGIYTVSKTLAKEYTGKGLIEPEQIMAKYTPSSQGSWAKGVNFFMNQLQ